MPVAVCAVTRSGQWSFCPPLLRDFPGKQCITPVKRVLIKKFRAINDNEKVCLRRNRDPVRNACSGVSFSRKRVFTEMVVPSGAVAARGRRSR